MATIDDEYDLEEGIPEEIYDTVDDSIELENIIELGTELMKKYNLSEKLMASYLIEAIKSSFSE